MWCTDRPGVVAALSSFLRDRGANILHAAQHSTDPEGGTFFMRLEFKLNERDTDRPAIERAFADDVARPLGWSGGSHMRRATPSRRCADAATLAN